MRSGIPITTPPRTLLDLAGEVTLRELERAPAEAQAKGLARPAQLSRLLSRYPGRRGVPALRGLLDDRPALTRSEAEERLRA